MRKSEFLNKVLTEKDFVMDPMLALRIKPEEWEPESTTTDNGQGTSEQEEAGTD